MASSLTNINHLLFVDDMKYNPTIYMAFMSELESDCLEIQSLMVGIGDGEKELVKSEEQDLCPLNWRIKVQKWNCFAASSDKLQMILKQTRGIFGVWGKEQYDYFHRFLDNVVNIEQISMTAVVNGYPKIDKSKRSVAELFLQILQKNAKHAGDLLREYDRMQFLDWIKDTAWLRLFKNDKQDYIEEESTEGSACDYPCCSNCKHDFSSDECD